MEFKGKIITIYKQSGNWICFRLYDERTRKPIVAKGPASGIFLPEMDVRIEGKYVLDPKYGQQIDIKEICPLESATAAYLSKFIDGIGPSLAKEIVSTLGEDCISKIMADTEILLSVKGIKKKKFEKISASFHSKKSIALYLSILEFFKNDITQNQVEKIVQQCEKNPKLWDHIQKNPYWLVGNIEGFGFKKVDKLALKTGLGEFSVERIEAAVVYSLQQISQKCGHCYADMKMLSREVLDLILEMPSCLSKRSYNRLLDLIDAGNDDEIDDFLKKNDSENMVSKWMKNYMKLIDVMCIALENDVKNKLIVIEGEKIYWRNLYEAEVNCAKIIANLAWRTPIRKINADKVNRAIQRIEDDEGCEFSDEQKRAVKTSLSRRISVITGGPGRGKTTILKAIIGAWNDDENVLLLAPTGRAAKRMTEATEYQAQTIHRFIGGFVKEHESIRGKLVIVDETSMIGILLASSLLSKVEDCNIIFVGDIDQLASIEPGCFMKDLIQCGHVKVSYLTKGFRNGGSIAKNSDLINQGKSMKHFILDDDTKFIKKDYTEPNAITDAAAEFYKEALKHYKVSDIGILSPLRSRGSGSVDAINELIRNQLNPVTAKNIKNKSGFLVNDRVMYTKNNYSKEIKNKYYRTELGIFNGDTGVVKAIDYEDEIVTVLFDDDRIGEFKYEEMDAFVLAWATTIHKSQGSEYKNVLVIASSQAAFFLKRNLLYTAFTRAKQKLTILGDENAVAIAARNIDDSIRYSFLKERINREITHSG